jgi:hypothetical protein
VARIEAVIGNGAARGSDDVDPSGLSSVSSPREKDEQNRGGEKYQRDD